MTERDDDGTRIFCMLLGLWLLGDDTTHTHAHAHACNGSGYVTYIHLYICINMHMHIPALEKVAVAGVNG